MFNYFEKEKLDMDILIKEVLEYNEMKVIPLKDISEDFEPGDFDNDKDLMLSNIDKVKSEYDSDLDFFEDIAPLCNNNKLVMYYYGISSEYFSKLSNFNKELWGNSFYLNQCMEDGINKVKNVKEESENINIFCRSENNIIKENLLMENVSGESNTKVNLETLSENELELLLKLKKQNKQDKKNIPSLKALLDEFIKDLKIINYGMKLFEYNGSYYQEIKNIKADIQQFLTDKFENSIPDAITPRRIDDIAKLIYNDKRIIIDDSFDNFSPSNYINFKNGFIDLNDDCKLYPHTSDIIFFSEKGGNWDINAKTDEITEKFLTNLYSNLSDEEQIKTRNLLFEILGVSLSNVRDFKNFFFIQGPKDTGKSTFCNLIRLVCDNSAVSSLPLSMLDENSFDLGGIIGKSVNLDSETKVDKYNLITLKKLTGGNEILSIRIKYKDNQNIRSNTLLIFAGNELMSGINDKSFIDRMIPISFSNAVSPEERIDKVEEKINIDYIIQESVKGLYRWMNNNKQFTIPEQVIENRELMSNDDIISDFYDVCEKGDELKISSKDLYIAFNMWKEFNGYSHKISNNLFTRRIKILAGNDTYKKSLRMDNTILSGFVGISRPGNEYLGHWGKIN